MERETIDVPNLGRLIAEARLTGGVNEAVVRGRGTSGLGETGEVVALCLLRADRCRSGRLVAAQLGVLPAGTWMQARPVDIRFLAVLC